MSHLWGMKMLHLWGTKILHLWGEIRKEIRHMDSSHEEYAAVSWKFVLKRENVAVRVENWFFN